MESALRGQPAHSKLRFKAADTYVRAAPYALGWLGVGMTAALQNLSRLDARRRDQTPQALMRLTVVGLFIGLWVVLWLARIPMPVPFLLVLVAEMLFFVVYWRVVFLLPTVKAIDVSHYAMLAAEIGFHTAIVYFLGGASWLGAFAYVFGLIFTNAFLDTRKAFLYTAGATAAFSTLVVLEATGAIPHYAYLEQGPLRHTDARFVITTLIGGVGVFFSIFGWVNWVGRQLRRERDTAVKVQDQLLEARAELQLANDELEARVQERTGLLELANAALRDSEQRLRTVVGNAPVVLFALDKEGSFTIAEGKALDDLGLGENALVGRSAFRMFEEQPTVSESIRRTLAGEPTTALVGTSVQFEAQLAPLCTEDGEVIGVIGVGVDVTERRLAGALLSGQRRVLEMIAIGAPLEEVLGSLVEVMEEQSDDMVCCICLVNADGSRLIPIAGPSLPAGFREALADGVPIGPSSGSCGTAAFRKQPVAVADIAADPIWEELGGIALEHGLRACWSTPIFAKRGDVLGTFAIYNREPRDPDSRTSSLAEVATRLASIAIERARGEAALQESEEVLKATVESTADGILVVNDTGEVIYANETFARMWRIPDNLLETRDDNKLLDFVLDQLAHPERFLAKVRELYQTSREDRDVLRFKDGRAFERFSRPLLRNDGAAGRVWSFRDITERSRAEEALRESESKFRTMAETVSAATFIFQGPQMKYVNSTAEQLTGYTREELLHMNFWDVIHPDVRDLVKERGMARQAGEEVPGGYEVKLQAKSGEVRWVDFTAGTIEFEGASAVLGTAFDITERKKAEAALQEAANHDPLTGLLNRRAGLAAIEERLELARSANGRFAVFVLDLDKFKVINDSFSHETGDAALVQFSQVLVELVGDHGVICRMGGDEFQVGLDDAGSDEAFTFASRVQQELRRRLMQSDAELRPQFTVSVGIACFPDDGASTLVLGRRADRAMYAAKIAGGDTYRAWHQLESKAA